MTKDVMVSFITYNGHTSSFCFVTVTFSFSETGTIEMENSIQSFSSEMYSSSDDFVRLCLELLFLVLSLVNFGSEVSEIVISRLETGKFSNYFTSVWNYIDMLNLLLFFYSSYLWTCFVRAISFYRPQERWEVLADLTSEGKRGVGRLACFHWRGLFGVTADVCVRPFCSERAAQNTLLRTRCSLMLRTGCPQVSPSAFCSHR